MQIGILSDTHDQLARTDAAVERLQAAGVEAVFHCGDIASEPVIAACSFVPLYFVFGNHDCDMVRRLEQEAEKRGATCLQWGGEVTLAGKRIAMAHGHLSMDLRPLLEAGPDYLFSGHTHHADDWREGPTRRINPGALHLAEPYSVAILNLESDELEFIRILE